MYEPTSDKVRCVHVCALPNLATLSHICQTLETANKSNFRAGQGKL